ncbi:FtsW/RodA/SpoVE family cell cycle protein [Persicitalea jodogahamensis]|uniref:Probable peptidoglycan glycosyltransferase FtsW n=1 Tax=Persicitalea jodogahamensis TaxID=402147 RepID=A0A8J3G9A0_9BACT|nr:FtsW/RodA/SpoVE family cell cycle protein [Persicitalea jodogahamensis]GHB71412.1 cell division protein FtsW [Persicitalea jodogahamensis]
MDTLRKTREITQAWFERNMKGDPWLWGIALFLLGGGVIVVYSASVMQAYMYYGGDTEFVLFKQIQLAIATFVIMYLVHLIPYTKFVFFSRMGVWLAVILLLFTFFEGVRVNEADRWIKIPIINQSFQPSEVAKITLIAHLALILALRFKKDWSDMRLLVEPMLMIGLVCALIFRSNVSTAALLGATCFMMLYVGKVPKRYLAITMVSFLVVSGLLVVLKVGQRGRTAEARLESFMDSDTVSMQSSNAYKAMARGGILGEGVAKSYQKHYLPNGDSDFIFAIIVEEYGLVGALVVIAAFLLLLYRGLRAISKPKRPYGGLLSAGLTFSIVFQAFATMAVTVGLFPTTGQTLPFISNGGTSMLLTGAAMGIILSVSRGELEEI